MAKINLDSKLTSSVNVFSYKNRGMSFEEEINLTNEYYRKNNVALIFKRPTPINVVSYDAKKKIITKAYYEKQSTTDYNGIYKGKYIDFEAKNTNSKTSFPLSNIKSFQLEHLNRVRMHNGISFLIVNFNLLNRCFIIMSDKINAFINSSNKKSIPLSYFILNGYEIKKGINPIIDYLSFLKNI